jgi:hypothetical protein
VLRRVQAGHTVGSHSLCQDGCQVNKNEFNMRRNCSCNDVENAELDESNFKQCDFI